MALTTVVDKEFSDEPEKIGQASDHATLFDELCYTYSDSDKNPNKYTDVEWKKLEESLLEWLERRHEELT